MKKFIAVLLAVIMVVSIAMIPASANEKIQETVTVSDLESVFADGENSLIVFVTGIGQSYSYLFDESYTKEGAFEKGTLQDYENYAPLIAEGKYQTRWNLFNDMGEAFSNPEIIGAIIKVVTNLISSSVTGKFTIKQEDVNTILRNLFKFNIPDGNGNSNARVVTPRYAVPVSEVTSQYPEYDYDVLAENEYVTFKYFEKIQNDNSAFWDKNRKNWLHILTDDYGENYNRTSVYPEIADQFNEKLHEITDDFKENRRGIIEQ